MRQLNSSSIAYAPAPIIGDVSAKYIKDELTKIAACIELLALGHLDKRFTAPTRPRDGDLAYADGTSWNPGSGKGVYIYKDTAWVFLG